MKQQSILAPDVNRSPAAHEKGHKNTISNEISSIQAKLTVGEPDDQYEKEADKVADTVMSMPKPSVKRTTEEDEEKLQTKPLSDQITPLIQRRPEEEEELIQTRLIQRESQEDEEKLQTKLIQRQPEEEENPIQAKFIQKQPEEEEEPLKTKLISRKEENSPSKDFSWLDKQLQGTKGSGNPLPEDTRAIMENRFGADFSVVKVHTDANAVQMNKQLNAQAFTHGNDIYFNSGKYSPESSSGKHLLAHELTHTLQQAKSVGHKIQRLQPIDISSEMIGQKIVLLEDQLAEDGKTIVTKGTEITIISWTNTDHFVEALAKINIMPFHSILKVDKKNIATVGNRAAGLTQYKAGVTKTQSEIIKGMKAIEAHQTKEAEYKKFKNVKGYNDEMARLENLQENRYTTLNENLIQETMFNRFDPIIVQWVNHYNTSLKPKNNLDPEIVKSLIHEESKMGTRGIHLEMPPYGWSGGTSYPIKSRFNIGQSIDSWGPQEYLMIREMSPAIYTKYNLSRLEKGNLWKSMSNRDYASWDNGNFVNAMAEFNSIKLLLKKQNLNLSSTSDLMEDYSFWIRVAVRWLFEKYFSMKTPSWSDAVSAFNGSGPKAKAYRKKVMDRVP